MAKGNGAGIKWLMAHVAHQGDECLIWPFYRMPVKGYGTLGYCGKVWKAHRLMCVLAKGEPPSPEHQAAHSCGRGDDGCVNPRHLSWKTALGNRLDSNEHGTGRPRKPRRLTLDQVEQIRASDRSNNDLAAEYDVHPETIARIFRGETWSEPRSTLTLEQIRTIREAPEDRCLKIGRSLGVNSIKVRKLRAGITFQGVE